LNFIGTFYPSIGKVTEDGIYGESTAAAVAEFKRLFEIPGDSERVSAQTWDAITDVYDDLYNGSTVSEGQYPGYNLGR
jgi:peptidoglycan hydrolase-like protein with peptidoglycan-binding domain